MRYFVEFFEENGGKKFKIVDENGNTLMDGDFLGLIDFDEEPERQPFTPTIVRKILGKPYCVVADDWGEIKIAGFDKVQGVIDFVLESVSGAKIDINDGEVKWDKAEDETTEEFWDWVAKQHLREQASKGGRATAQKSKKFLKKRAKKGGQSTAKRGKSYFAEIGKKGAAKRWKKGLDK